MQTFWVCLIMIIGSGFLYHNYEQRIIKLSESIDAMKTIRVFWVSQNQTLDALNDTELLGISANLAAFLREFHLKTTTVNVAIDNIMKLINGGWRPFQGRLYYVVKHKMSFDLAQSECEKLKTVMPTVITPDEEHMMEMLSKQTSSGVWIGLQKVKGNWTWLDGTPYNVNESYWNEAVNTPGPVPELCTEVLNECKSPGLCWDDADCIDHKHPVCVMFPDSTYLP